MHIWFFLNYGIASPVTNVFNYQFNQEKVQNYVTCNNYSTNGNCLPYL